MYNHFLFCLRPKSGRQKLKRSMILVHLAPRENWSLQTWYKRPAMA